MPTRLASAPARRLIVSLGNAVRPDPNARRIGSGICKSHADHGVGSVLRKAWRPVREVSAVNPATCFARAAAGADRVLTVEPYDIDALKKVFADADANGWFIEAMFLEPVMGEGDPGRAVPRAFYDIARELTKAHGALLLIDSIQAGLRAHGVLSIVDYAGFEGIDPPDMETYSKALNAAQYPLSVLAVNARAAGLYRKGTYGNTMTANPRALDVACTVLGLLTPELRANIRTRGKEAIAKLEALKTELPGLITKVQGTGLLFSCELSREFKGYGTGSTEEWMREHGIGVIHGGENSLRFTPGFNIQSDELDLLIGMVKRALLEGPRVAQAAAA